MRRLLSLVCIVVALLAAACSSAPAREAASPSSTASGATPTPRPVQKLVFMAGFRPQANLPFVAAYLAAANGYFAEEGLDVDIRHASGQDEHLKLLLAKEVAFTTASGPQVLRRREDGLPVRAVALFGQRGDQGFVVRADAGIQTPADLRGRTVGFKAGIVTAEFHALLATAGLTINDVRLQAVGFDPRIFIERGVEVFPVFLGNEPFAIRKAGVAIRTLDPAELGVPTLGLTYLAHADTVAADPDMVRRFLRATLRATQYAFDHVDEAVTATLKYAPGADPAQQRALLETDLAAARRADGIGRSSQQQWDALEATLLNFGVLKTAGSASTAFTATIVDSLYDAQGRLR